MDPDRIIWSGRPYSGLAWRPQDLSFSIVTSLWTSVALFMSFGKSWFFFAIVMCVAGYLLLGRLYHDAHLRRRIRYELSTAGLAVWIDGREAPECEFDLFSLRNVEPQFVTRSGRGTIELPPGGWAAQPAWFNRWDRDVPAMYPCRRLELVDEVEAVAEMLRRQAQSSGARISLNPAPGAAIDRPGKKGTEKGDSIHLCLDHGGRLRTEIVYVCLALQLGRPGAFQNRIDSPA